jgi:hypothetical protein
MKRRRAASCPPTEFGDALKRDRHYPGCVVMAMIALRGQTISLSYLRGRRFAPPISRELNRCGLAQLGS